uniref:Chitin-binding type-2 domain-containing protein n=1 Tax=Megaselia scalaris TaxID=36166 RepID=T1GBK9_MEGSC
MPGAVVTCAAGTVCSINSATASGDSFCQVPAGFPSSHDCESQCIGICPADVNEPGRINFICTGPNRYRYCSEAFEDDQDRYCPLGQVCTIDAPCVSATTNSSLCSRPIDPTPNANTICIGKLDRAKYPLVPPDPYCQRYVYCRYHGGIAKGTIYRCPSRQQFNKLTGRCERSPVADCWNIF